MQLSPLDTIQVALTRIEPMTEITVKLLKQ